MAPVAQALTRYLPAGVPAGTVRVPSHWFMPWSAMVPAAIDGAGGLVGFIATTPVMVHSPVAARTLMAVPAGPEAGSMEKSTQPGPGHSVEAVVGVDGATELAVVTLVVAGVGALHTCFPAAESLARADSVSGPTMPSTGRPDAAWKPRMAASVSPPSSPSTGPASQPTALSCVCHSLISSLEASDVFLPLAAVLLGAAEVPDVDVVLVLLLLLQAPAVITTAASMPASRAFRVPAIVSLPRGNVVGGANPTGRRPEGSVSPHPVAASATNGGGLVDWAAMPPADRRLEVELHAGAWAPRLDQLRTRTLPVMLERLERQGVVDNFRRLAGTAAGPRRALHFSDSDLYKWLEASLLAGRVDLAEEVVGLVEAVAAPDGYVHTHYGTDDGPARYTDLDFGHEQYCHGHLIEAAIAHHEATGSDRLLGVALRLADHLCATFGPGRDERTDAHPEVELALCRLATLTGRAAYVDQAAWIIEAQLARAGLTIDDPRLGGHAVRALYLTSGIAEVALATGEARWVEAATRRFDAMVDRHAYPTGAVGGRWLGEMVGAPYEQPDAMSYAESCAAVAATQLSARIWRLTGDRRALDQIELLLANAVPCGVGAGGDTWFYSQPHAVAEVADDPNPWLYGFDYGQLMLRSWFPARRHRWFDVPCCPPNLARLFATVDRYVAEIDAAGDLLIHQPLAGRIRGAGWDVTIEGDVAETGAGRIEVAAAPVGGTVRVRRPGWAAGAGHEPVPADGVLTLPVDWTWWTTDHRVEGAAGSVHLRRGAVVYCAEGVDHPGVDLRDLVVDPTRPPGEAFTRRSRDGGDLHRPVADTGTAVGREPISVSLVRYRDWANRGDTTMRLRFPTA